MSNSDFKALVTDDHMVIRQIVSQHLRDMGVTDIDTASDSDDAQKKIAEKQYDLVFLDWHMPGKSGYNLMREYREDRCYDHIAFIMVTAESHEKSVIEALKAGATSYIIKPVSRDEFQRKVSKVMEWLKSRPGRKASEAK